MRGHCEWGSGRAKGGSCCGRRAAGAAAVGERASERRHSSAPALVLARSPAPRAPTTPPPLAAPHSNSEIYNHQALRDGPLAGVDIPSRSDSSIVGYLYQQHGDTNELWNSLDGIFACVIWDERTGHFCIARDPIGICSLYWGRGADGSVWVASEMKALQDNCETVDFFPPVRAGGRARAEGGAAVARLPRGRVGGVGASRRGAAVARGCVRARANPWSAGSSMAARARTRLALLPCRGTCTAAARGGWRGGSSPTGST